MMGTHCGPVDRDLAHALGVRGGVARASDLRAAGISRGRMRGALARGEVVRLASRLYADPLIDLSRESDRRVAALVQGGPDAVLSHATAAAVRRWREARAGEDVHVTVGPGEPPRGLPGVVMHQSRLIERERCSGWPVTSPRSTLVGLASDMDENALRFPALAAVQRGHVTTAELSDAAGVPQRALGRWNRVAAEAAAGAESGGEGLFWRVIHESRLPDPHLNAWLMASGRRYRIDALWPQFRLGAEIDGREHHTKVGDFDSDHLRQNHIHAEGIVLIRFTVRQVLDSPGDVLRQTQENLVARCRELVLDLGLRG